LIDENGKVMNNNGVNKISSYSGRIGGGINTSKNTSSYHSMIETIKEVREEDNIHDSIAPVE
jgi:hypothetical protein